MSTPITSAAFNKILLSNLNEFRENQKFCDVFVRIADQTFPCHQVVLASTLSYFREKFSDNFTEKERQEISLEDTNVDTFEQLLTFIYTNWIHLNDCNVYNLFKLSHQLGLECLANLCMDYVLENDSISTDTKANVLVFATCLVKNILPTECVEWMAENFSILSKNQTFLTISGTELLKIFTHSSMDKDMTTVIDFLAEWTKFSSTEDRTTFLPNLLNAVELGNIPVEWFVDVLTPNTEVNETGSVQLLTPSTEVNETGGLWLSCQDEPSKDVLSEPTVCQEEAIITPNKLKISLNEEKATSHQNTVTLNSTQENVEICEVSKPRQLVVCADEDKVPLNSEKTAVQIRVKSFENPSPVSLMRVPSLPSVSADPKNTEEPAAIEPKCISHQPINVVSGNNGYHRVVLQQRKRTHFSSDVNGVSATKSSKFLPIQEHQRQGPLVRIRIVKSANSNL